MYVPGKLQILKDINYKLIVKYFTKEQHLKSFNVNISLIIIGTETMISVLILWHKLSNI